MGGSESKIVEAIKNPNEDAALRKLFGQFDKDKSGSLDKEEWKLFGKYLWLADIKEATEDVKHEVREEFKSKAPMMAGLMGSAASSATGLIAKGVQPSDVDKWIESLFARADKDNSGSLSYDEFKVFLEHENKAEADAHKAKLRDAVATNIEQNYGSLNVTVKDGAVTKSATVTVDGVDTEAIRNKK
jgi:Ca2+-binding EF-hand superfamily protein